MQTKRIGYLFVVLAVAAVAAVVLGRPEKNVPERQQAPMRPAGQPADFGQFFDGQSHPLSSRFSSLDDARRIYPRATDLAAEEFPLLLQRTIDEAALLDSLAGGIPPIELPSGVALWDRPVTIKGKQIRIVGRGMMQT